jgi:hypothetical protein
MAIVVNASDLSGIKSVVTTLQALLHAAMSAVVNKSSAATFIALLSPLLRKLMLSATQ